MNGLDVEQEDLGRQENAGGKDSCKLWNLKQDLDHKRCKEAEHKNGAQVQIVRSCKDVELVRDEGSKHFLIVDFIKRVVFIVNVVDESCDFKVVHANLKFIFKLLLADHRLELVLQNEWSEIDKGNFYFILRLIFFIFLTFHLFFSLCLNFFLFINDFIVDGVVIEIGGVVVECQNLSLLFDEFLELGISDVLIEVKLALLVSIEDLIEKWEEESESPALLGVHQRTHDKLISRQVRIFKQVFCNKPDLSGLLILQDFP